MANDWKNALDRMHAATNPGASTEDLTRFEREGGLKLPSDFRNLIRSADGFELEDIRLKFLSLDEMREYLPVLNSGAVSEHLGYVAFTDSNDSNPFCLCTIGPLAGYVVRVHHDDDAEVAYRSLDRFFSAVESLVRLDPDQRRHVDDLKYDFGVDRSLRSAEDERRGAGLISAAETFSASSDERCWLLILAFQLLSPAKVDVVAGYLEDEPFVRREARDTLKAFATPEASLELRRDDAAMAAYAREVIATLQNGGVKVIAAKDDVVSILPGPIHLDLNTWFSERHDPSAMQRIVGRVEKWLGTK